MNWKYTVYNTLILDIFTESDVASYILLLENNAEEYAKIHDMNKNAIERIKDQSILMWIKGGIEK